MSNWQAEYAEAYRQFRQIDTRIWGVYGLYFAVAAAGAGYLTTEWPPDAGNSLKVAAALVLLAAITVAQFALVGHLQWFSDIIADRIREIERLHGIPLGSLLGAPDDSSARLWGPHRWLMAFRARDVMQMIGLSVLFTCFVLATVVGLTALGFTWGTRPATDAVLIICATVVAIAYLSAIVALKASEHRLRIAYLRYGHEGQRSADLSAPHNTLGGLVLFLAVALLLTSGLLLPHHLAGGALLPIGLALGLAGAICLIGGELRIQAARIRLAAKTGHEVKADLLQWLPVQLAKRCGSRHASDTQESVVESLTSRFWGLLLLAAGFGLQVLAVVLG